jgi:catechol 2,3-dioxygenase-like lactoylglutathione lyase family enzyme
MKRLHLHVSVPEIERSIDFYTALFGQAPAVIKDDYARWILDDPQVNFAISRGRGGNGVNHLGFQVDSDDMLDTIQSRLDAAGLDGAKESDVNCCYANSNKYWTVDPAGIPWEQFHTLADVPTFGGSSKSSGCGCGTNTANGSTSSCCH